MHRIDTPRAVANPETPAPAGTPGHFSGGVPLTGQRATAVSPEWCEAVQEELIAILTWLGVTPAKASNGQIAAALAAALALKAPLLNAALTGTPSAPTAAPGTNTTQIANTAFVTAAINALINAAPGALDTLKELADALGDDANFATTMTTALALKAPLASPALTGNPTAPTQAAGDNSTKIATTAQVHAALAAQANISGNYHGWTNGSTLAAWTHGLGGVPHFVSLQATCITAEHGYAIGDVVLIPVSSFIVISYPTYSGATAKITSTQVSIRIAAHGLCIADLDSDHTDAIDATKWDLKIVAARFA